MQAGWRNKYYVNGLEVQLILIKELRRLFHLGPAMYITPRRMMKTDWSRIKASLLAIDRKREPMKEQCDIIYNWKAEVERLSRLQKLLDEENELKRSLSSMNKKINTSKANNGNINEQMEASSKKQKAITAEEPTLIEEDKKQTTYYEAASELFYNQREIDTTNSLLSMFQEDEVRLKINAEEIRVTKEDAKRKLTEEHNRVYRLQEVLDSLRATISIEFDTGWARATKFLKGKRPEKIASQFFLNREFSCNSGSTRKTKIDMEKN
ncbi:hypothetical protein Tco_0392934 [Tanacetum coccineum]